MKTGSAPVSPAQRLPEFLTLAFGRGGLGRASVLRCAHCSSFSDEALGRFPGLRLRLLGPPHLSPGGRGGAGGTSCEWALHGKCGGSPALQLDGFVWPKAVTAVLRFCSEGLSLSHGPARLF